MPCQVGLKVHIPGTSRGDGGEREPVLVQGSWEEAALGEGWAGEKKGRERSQRENYLESVPPATLQVTWGCGVMATARTNCPAQNFF